MAVLSKVILGACALASVAQALPAMFTAYDMVTVTHWETVDCTSTVWRPWHEKPSGTGMPNAQPVASAMQTSAPAAEVSAAPAAPSPPPAIAPSVQTLQAAAPSFSQAPVASMPAQAIPTTMQTSVTPMTAAPVAPAPASSSVAAPVAPSPASSAVASVAAAPSASAGSFSPASASASNSCEGTGAACVGDITHWDGGLGACGFDVNTSSDMMVALPVGFMGSLSNNNPFCKRSVTVHNPTTGKSVQATVGDKCMGCEARAIDCTDALFNAITDGQGDGRVSGIQWWLN